ncbi:MAG: ATP-dependent DNA ligase [Gemmataceae bacterium]|nr:ATP-dependent DNA ligase [Gemmataceae bacterium]
MRAFAGLYAALDGTTKTSEKVRALVAYFKGAAPADAAWAVFFLSGRKVRQVVPTRRLAAWANEQAGIEPWLFEECYHAVGDLAEAIALLLPEPAARDGRPLSAWVAETLLPLREATEDEQKRGLLAAWASLSSGERFVWNKLITGGFRVGVSQQLLTRAVADAAGLDPALVAHRLMGDWQPTAAFWSALVSEEAAGEDRSRPYPFFLASPLEGEPPALGDIAEWQAEWKWDGIRAQLVKRGEVFLWSRGEELVTDRYPEVVERAKALPDGTVIDGELLPWRGGVLPFAQLQRRIGRKTVGKKLLAEVPVVLLAYDVLEHAGKDVRPLPLSERRRLLESLGVEASPVIGAGSWEELAALRGTARERMVEGMMLKRRSSPYRVGRVRGDWWKWKIGPLTVDAVLTMAQRGSGKRASLYTDYTFSVWDEGALVPFAKAYSGLTDEEIAEVDAFVRKNTREKFGPVRSVRPELVFELGFEGIQRSTRHKSGIAVRFPRILRWRQDKKPADADTLERVKALAPPEPAPAKQEWTQGELFG